MSSSTEPSVLFRTQPSAPTGQSAGGSSSPSWPCQPTAIPIPPQLLIEWTVTTAVASITGVAGDDVPPTSHAIPLTNVFRDDVVVPGLTAEEALSGAPEVEQQRFAVPRILGDEQ